MSWALASFNGANHSLVLSTTRGKHVYLLIDKSKLTSVP